MDRIGEGFEVEQLLKVGLMLLALVIILGVISVLSGHGTSVINYFKDLVRFGR